MNNSLYSTDHHAPSTTAPGKTHSGSTETSPVPAAPGAPLSPWSHWLDRDRWHLSVVLPFAAVAILLAVAWTQRQGMDLPDWQETLRALAPTLSIFGFISCGFVGWIIGAVFKGIVMEEGQPSDSDPIRATNPPAGFVLAEKLQDPQGNPLVVLHLPDGWVRLRANALVENAFITDVDRLERWVNPSNEITATITATKL